MCCTNKFNSCRSHRTANSTKKICNILVSDTTVGLVETLPQWVRVVICSKSGTDTCNAQCFTWLLYQITQKNCMTNRKICHIWSAYFILGSITSLNGLEYWNIIENNLCLNVSLLSTLAYCFDLNLPRFLVADLFVFLYQCYRFPSRLQFHFSYLSYVLHNLTYPLC